MLTQHGRNTSYDGRPQPPIHVTETALRRFADGPFAKNIPNFVDGPGLSGNCLTSSIAEQIDSPSLKLVTPFQSL